MSAPHSARAVRPRRRRLWPVVPVLGVLITIGWLAFAQPWEATPIAVTVETAVSGPTMRVLAVNGRVEPETQIEVQPTVSGQIRTVSVSDGDRVEAGDLLVTLDDTQQRATVSQAEAALSGARVQLEKAQSDYTRAQRLSDSISQKDLSAALTALQTVQNDVARLQAARDQALSQLDAFTIRAPFAGTVVTRGVDPGQVVSPSTVLFSLADLNHLRASASVDELYAAQIRRGLKVKMQPSGYNQTLSGLVSFVSPTVDSSTGGRMVRVGISDDTTGMALPIGLTVNLNIVVDEQPNAITVPRPAIVDAATQPAVLLVKGGRAVRTPIEFVDWPAGRLIVTSGLKAGDAVITNPSPAMIGARLLAAQAR